MLGHFGEADMILHPVQGSLKKWMYSVDIEKAKMRVDIQDASWVSLIFSIRSCGCLLLPSSFLLLWRPRGKLESVDATFLSHLVLHERVDHAVACQLRLAFKS